MRDTDFFHLEPMRCAHIGKVRINARIVHCDVRTRKMCVCARTSRCGVCMARTLAPSLFGDIFTSCRKSLSWCFLCKPRTTWNEVCLYLHWRWRCACACARAVLVLVLCLCRSVSCRVGCLPVVVCWIVHRYVAGCLLCGEKKERFYVHDICNCTKITTSRLQSFSARWYTVAVCRARQVEWQRPSSCKAAAWALEMISATSVDNSEYTRRGLGRQFQGSRVCGRLEVLCFFRHTKFR